MSIPVVGSAVFMTPATSPSEIRCTRARRLGLKDADFDRKYALDELVRGDAVFSATGVTDGALLDGVKIRDGYIHTHTVVMTSATGTVSTIRTKHRL